MKTALLLIAAAMAALGVFLGHLHDTQGPPVQRINIRWAASVSPDERRRIEQDTFLLSATQVQDRTWSYRLGDRSRDTIGRLLRDARVEDTFHLDPQSLTVTLDRPDLAPWLRALLETDRVGTVGRVLQLLALLIAALEWRRVIALATRLARAADRLAREVAFAAAEQFRAREGACSRREIAAGIVLAVFFLVPLLMYGPFEDEIVQATIMPNQVFYRALARGDWLYWLNDIGFGSPMPLGDPLLFHPVFGPLAAFASLRVTLSGVWIAHAVVMAVYFLRLLAVSGVASPVLRLLFLVLYFVSMQFAFYFYTSDWVQMAVTWSLYPVIVFYLRSAVAGGAQLHPWRTAALLGLIFGFWVINAHPGYIIPLTLVLVAYVLVAAPLDRRVYLSLAAGGVLCAAIVAPRIYMLLYEVRLFPAGGAIREGGSPAMWAGALLAPWQAIVDRGPFVGLGVGIAVVAAAFTGATLRDRHLRGCLAALLTAIVFNLLPAEILTKVLPAVGAYLFRDAITFFSLIVAARVLQLGVTSPRPLLRHAALALVLLQFIQQGSLVGPDFAEVTRRGNRLLFYRHQQEPAGLARVLVDRGAQYGRRVYLSPEVDRAMKGSLSADGIHFSSDLVLHGLNPVNGWFKNISMAALYPPFLLMESTIQGDVDVIRNRSLRDVLGIDLVLSTISETGVPAGLIEVERPSVHSERLRGDLVLLANPTAWPQAVLLAPAAATLPLPLRPGCGHTAALCREYEPLARTRLEGAVGLSASQGSYQARVPPAAQERVLFFSTLYRPEWEAATAAGAPLPVRRVADAFLGVVVPPGVSEMSVTYRPRTVIALTWLGNSVFFALACVVLLPLAWRARPGHRRAEALAA